MVLDPRLVDDCIIAIWIIWAIYWAVKAFGNKRAVYRQSRGSRGLYLGVMFVAIWLISEIPWPAYKLFRVSAATQIAGIVICAGGIGLAIRARRILGGNWSGVITIKEDHQLIRVGPYRFVRHPIYTGIILAAVGDIIATAPTVHGVVLVVVLAVALKVKSLGEEKILIPQFPQSYPNYQREVKSLIPFIW